MAAFIAESPHARLTRIIAEYNATGRLAHLHPRKYVVSLNGGRPLDIRTATERMLAVIGRDRWSM